MDVDYDGKLFIRGGGSGKVKADRNVVLGWNEDIFGLDACLGIV